MTVKKALTKISEAIDNSDKVQVKSMQINMIIHQG